MKKSISLLLAVLFMFSVIPQLFVLTADAALVTPSQFDNISNVMLMYTDGKSGSASSKHTVQTLLPYVAYTGTNNQVLDTFFDSFLVLPSVTTGPSGGTMYKSDNPAIASDWQAFYDNVFADGYNIDALNETAGIVKNQLNKPDYKLKIFFALIYPNDGQKNFGSLGGTNYNFVYNDQRKAAVKYEVDYYISRFNSGNYENLELAGFYWFEESIDIYSSREMSLVKTSTDYIRSKGYKSIWIPYFNARGWSSWKSCGFDIACLQPNYMFYETSSTRVQTAINNAKAYNMCNEVEISGNVMTNSEQYEKYITYLRDFVKYGAMNAVKMYYQDVFLYYYLSVSKNDSLRMLYDLTYKLAKCTLKESDLNGLGFNSEGVSKLHEIVSYGCKYTATTPYTNTSAEYGQISGKELTDGVYSGSSFGTEWHGFHNSLTESDGNYHITVDLGKQYDNLGYIYIEFNKDLGASISLPAVVDIYVSEDGKNFTKFTQLAVNERDAGAPAAIYNGAKFSARYVRAVIPKGAGGNFVFCCEMAIGLHYGSIEIDEEFNIISTNCKYTATTPFTDKSEWEQPYMEVDGKELTDGVYATSVTGTEWHDFHVTNLPASGKYQITVDLGKKYDNIGYFNMQFGNAMGYGIMATAEVKYYASDDGNNFYLVATAETVMNDDGYYYAEYQSQVKIAARYIKAEFAPPEGFNHCFVSEIVVATGNLPEEEKGGLGDVTGDGKIDTFDYLLVRSHILNLTTLNDKQLKAGDVTEDGKIDTFDYLRIRAHILGINTIKGW